MNHGITTLVESSGDIQYSEKWVVFKLDYDLAYSLYSSMADIKVKAREAIKYCVCP